MSRSRKKHGWIKDRGWKKGIYNKQFRRVNKQRISMGKHPLQMKELINPYDVCDWKIYWGIWKDINNDDPKQKLRYFNK